MFRDVTGCTQPGQNQSITVENRETDRDWLENMVGKSNHQRTDQQSSGDCWDPPLGKRRLASFWVWKVSPLCVEGPVFSKNLLSGVEDHERPVLDLLPGALLVLVFVL